MSAVPRSPAAIDVAWLGSRLGRQVEAVRVETIDARRGVNAETYRLHLRGSGVPASVVAKFPGEVSRGVARFQRWYEREVGFYRQLAADTPLRSPRCFAAEIDDADNFVILMEDLGGLRQGDQVAGCSLDEAYRVVRSLAAMHAHWWQSPSIEWLPFTTVGLDRAGPVQSAFARAWSHVRHLVPSEAHRAVDAAVGEYESLLAEIAAPPVTLCHGDFRLDNLFLPPSPADVIAFDWQFACRARGMYDVAYFLALDLDPALLAEHEEALIGAYVESLVASGMASDRTPGTVSDAPPYTATIAHTDYATSLLLSLAVFAIGAASPQLSDASRLMHEVGLERLGQAVGRIWQDRVPGR